MKEEKENFAKFEYKIWLLRLKIADKGVNDFLKGY